MDPGGGLRSLSELTVLLMLLKKKQEAKREKKKKGNVEARCTQHCSQIPCMPTFLGNQATRAWKKQEVHKLRQFEIRKILKKKSCRTEARSGAPPRSGESSCFMFSGCRLKCYTVLDLHHERVVTIVLLTNPGLCTGCVYFKISSNYLTMPQRYAWQKKNAMCIFRVNAGVVTVKTPYSSANTPLTLKWTASWHLCARRSFKGDLGTRFLLTLHRTFANLRCWELRLVCHREKLSNNGQKGFPLFYDGEPELWPPAIHSVWSAVERKELAPNAEMCWQMLGYGGSYVIL